MGQRFQCYVSYGKQDEPGAPGGNLFAMHLQWCWGPFAIIRAHQLVDFIDGARENRFNPFGLGECSQVGGMSFDGRREDLYLLKALTEINTVSSSIVAGHDLMVEAHGTHKWLLEQDEISSIPSTIKMDPLAQDNNDGFLVIQATADEVKYAFCKDTSALEPIDASEYLNPYRGELERFDGDDRTTVEMMEEILKGYPLLSKVELAQIFDREYEKSLNIEGYKEPERKLSRHEPLSEVVKEAKNRAAQSQPAEDLKKADDKFHAAKKLQDPSL